VYASGDMMIHNRRKRREYFAEQQALHTAQVYEAQQAARRGMASEEQQALLQKEEQILKMEEAKQAAKNAPGVFGRTKEWLISGLKKEEDGGAFSTSEEKVGYDGTVAEDEVIRSGESKILKAVQENNRDAKEAAERSLKTEVEVQRRGGPLDQLPTPAVTAEASSGDAPKQGGGWTSFMSRR
jgi:hypothetical protein